MTEQENDPLYLFWWVCCNIIYIYFIKKLNSINKIKLYNNNATRTRSKQYE